MKNPSATPPTYSIYYGTTYGKHAADGATVQEGAAASSAYGNTTLGETFELIAPNDYTKLPTKFDQAEVASVLQTYFDDELGSDVVIDRVLSVVYLGRLLAEGASPSPAMRQLFFEEDYRQWPDVVRMRP